MSIVRPTCLDADPNRATTCRNQPPSDPISGFAEAPPSSGQLTDEQAVERYRYLLRTAPPEAIEQAHAEAFAQLTPEQRRLVLEGLSEDLPPQERADRDDPQSLARMATRAELRQPGTLERTFGGIDPAAGSARRAPGRRLPQHRSPASWSAPPSPTRSSTTAGTTRGTQDGSEAAEDGQGADAADAGYDSGDAGFDAAGDLGGGDFGGGEF